MVTKKIIPGSNSVSEDGTSDLDMFPQGDFDYAHIGAADNAESALSKFTVVGLVMLVAAGIGGGLLVSARLPGVGTNVAPVVPVRLATVLESQIITPPPVTSVNTPKNIPRPPGAANDLQDGWEDISAIEPAAGTPSESAPDGSPTSTTTTTTTTTNSQQVMEVPAQPPEIPNDAPSTGAATTTTTTTTTASSVPDSVPGGNTAAAPALTAPDANLPAIGGAVAPSVATAGETGSATGPVSGTSAAPVSPTPETAKPSGPDAYYDSAAPPPPGMANVVGPRAVNPVKEPGSKFIIVEKNTGPQSTDSRIMMADRALKLGHYEAAADMFDALYKKNSRDPRILMGRAVAFQKSGRTEAALKTYDQLLTIDHNNPEALVNMLGILRTEYPEVALRRLKNLHEKFPANAMIAAQIGVTEADGGHLADAVRFLGMAVSMEPDNAQHLFNMAIVQDRAGKKDDAIKYYQQALETDAIYGDSQSVPREQIYDRLSVLRQQ
jgi:Tfp pilus assembly protein PilF